MKKIILSSFLFIALFSSCNLLNKNEIRDDFKQSYDAYKVQGSFVLYDLKNDKYLFYNRSQFEQVFTPASTFKICNSLIGLETGVIADENFVIQWDSVVRKRPAWNKSQDLKTAFKNSTVWYYQELARRVGGQKMKFWLDKTQYGNADTMGGIDKFWLSGGLRISPKQQIEFLKRLYLNQLPFAQRNMDIVKKVMVAVDSANYTIRAKTGWGMENGTDIGWYVGYYQTKANVYFFANCIQNADTTNQQFANARIEICKKIFETLKLRDR